MAAIKAGSNGLAASDCGVALTIIMNRMVISLFPGQLFGFGAQALFFLAEFGRKGLAEVFHFEDLAEFYRALLEGCLLDPLDGFFFRLHFPDPVTGDELFRFSERSIDDDLLSVFEL